MTPAEIEFVDPDVERAHDFVAQSRQFLADAERGTTSLESAVVLYWQTCISSLDAILTAAGRRVGSGERSHAVRIEASAALLGAGYSDLIERLDEWRRARVAVSSAAVTPAAADVSAMQADARDILAAAERYVSAATN